MDATPLQGDFSLLTGNAELLGRVGPLWSQLRRHHADLSPRWSAGLLATSFAQRRVDLVSKGARGLLVSVATTTTTTGEQDIGYCVSTITAERTGEVDSLYVVPSQRGCGVGHALMSAALNWFGGHSIESIVVDVINGNDAAQQFYARYGFGPRTVRMVRPCSGVA